MKLPQAFYCKYIKPSLKKAALLGRQPALIPAVVLIVLVGGFTFMLSGRQGRPDGGTFSRPVVSHATPTNARKLTTITIAQQENAESAQHQSQQAKSTELTGNDFKQPLQGKVLRSTSTGPVWWPILQDYRQHVGSDIEAPAGTRVVAAASGTVTELGRDPVYGTVLVIEHPGGWQTVYGGLQEVKVHLNQKVQSGQELARVGPPSGGEADLPAHLHYELRRDGNIVNSAHK